MTNTKSYANYMRDLLSSQKKELQKLELQKNNPSANYVSESDSDSD